MRNLQEHQVTQDEEISTLRSVAAELEKQQNMGDVRPAVLRANAERIESQKQ